jgi:hypothetical protein
MVQAVDCDRNGSRPDPTTDPPAWLIAACEIGVSIANLTANEQSALEERWRFWVASRERKAMRRRIDMRFQDAKNELAEAELAIVELKRRGNMPALANRRRQAAQLNKEIEWLKKVAGVLLEEKQLITAQMRRLTERLAYQSAMARLCSECEDPIAEPWSLVARGVIRPETSENC